MSNTIVIVFTNLRLRYLLKIQLILFMLVKRALNVSKINNVLVNVEININKD